MPEQVLKSSKHRPVVILLRLERRTTKVLDGGEKDAKGWGRSDLCPRENPRARRHGEARPVDACSVMSLRSSDRNNGLGECDWLISFDKPPEVMNINETNVAPDLRFKESHFSPSSLTILPPPPSHTHTHNSPSRSPPC